jgi:hypothetical protein
MVDSQSVPLNPIKELHFAGYPEVKEQNGKLLPTDFVNPIEDGSTAIVTKKNLDGFVEINSALKIIDDYSEITAYFESQEGQVTLNSFKQSGKYLSGGKLVGNKVYFLSNLHTGHSTMYTFDKTSRNVSKFNFNRSFDDVVFLGTGNNYLLIQNASSEQTYKVTLDGKCEPIDVPGAIINVSQTGRYIAFEPYDAEGNLTRGINVIDISNKATNKLFEKTADLLLNSKVYFSPDDKWLATALYSNKSQKPDELLIVNTKTREKLYKKIKLEDDKFGNPLPVMDGKDSLIFIDDNQILLTFERGRTEIINYK